MRLLLVLALLAALGPGCFRDTGRGRGGRGILVIAVDSLRADHVSLPGMDGQPGYDRRTTPTLEALARQGIWFPQCFSPAPERIPAHAGILTGCDPRLVRRPPVPPGMFLALSREWMVPRGVPSLARELLALGFRTAAFVDDPHLDERLGFSSGFETYQRFPQTTRDGPGYGLSVISARLLNWLRDIESDRDWFAYVTIKDLERVWLSTDPARDTYFEPRSELSAVPPISSSRHPYFAIPVDRWDGGLNSVGEYESRYDGAIRQMDLMLQRLFRQLQERGLWERTTICIVGSFGVGLGEAGMYLTTGTLADVDLHVPWVLKPPSFWEGPRGVPGAHLASTIDVLPTVMELNGIQPPAGTHGVSQARSNLPGARPARRYAFASGGVQAGIAVRTADWTYLLTRPAWSSRRDYVTTWTGLRQGVDPAPREHLTRRLPRGDPGDLGPSLDLPDVKAELLAVGEEWYLWLDRARDALHEVPWYVEPQDPALLLELVERGLVAPQYAP